MAKTGKSQVVASTDTEVTQEQRGREETVDPSGTRPRAKSKDRISSIESRLTNVEEGVGGMGAQVDDLTQRMEGLEAEDAEVHTAMKAMMVKLEETVRAEMGSIKDHLMGELSKLRDSLEKEVHNTKAQLEALQADVALCKRAMVAGPSTTVETRRVEVPRPRTFGGSRNAQEVDNFLYGLDQYLGALGIVEDASKIQTASLYLTDTAMLWWRRRRNDIEKGTCTISTFDDFKRELKRQFYPENAEDEARARLRRLKQSGSIRDYIKDFTNLVLEIPDLSDKDSLFNFMDGLQLWAKTELKRRGVQNLADAIAKAESLVDYSNHKEFTSKPKEQKEGQAKVWRDRSPRKETHRDNTPLRHKESSSWKGKTKDAQGLRKPSSSKCFICDGDHWARQCPQRQALSSLLARYQEDNDVEGCQEGAHIGSLQLLNGIQSTPKIETKGLLFVDVAINGKATRAMVDTGASHNFISPKEATRLGVKVTRGKGSIKAVNSAAKPIHGIAQEVKTDVGTWSGRLNFSIVPMDDYKLILGIEFLDQVKAIPMPFANAMSITEGNQACVVPMIRGTKQESKVLSALQLEEEDTNRASWETEEALWQFKDQLQQFNEGATRASRA
ncbi:hypothetical protein GQ457_07G007230 [Hibiscus cannabinus]